MQRNDAISDRSAITELVYRYCRAVDRLDVALGHSVWHEDGFADYGADYYQGNGRGVIDRICEDHRKMLYHSHQVSNILISLEDDLATSESYAIATLRHLDNGDVIQFSVWVRYLDQWSRRGGRWGLDRRQVVRDFDEIRAVTPVSHQTLARRDAGDPSYALAGFARGKASV